MPDSFLFLTIHPKSVYATFRDAKGNRSTASEPHDGSVYSAQVASDKLTKVYNPEAVEISFNTK